MAISLISVGGWSTGTDSLLVPYPAGVQAGDLLALPIANKYPNNGPSLPAGWLSIANCQASGGSGSNGIDSGSVYSTVLIKVADGTESGNLSLSLPSGNCAVAQMVLYRKAADKNWGYACTNGSDNTPGTSWSVTGSSDPGIASGDRALTCSAINTDSYTFSSHAITATGVTFGVLLADGNGTSLGEDCYCVLTDHEVSSGTSSAPPVFTMSSSGTATNIPAGATVILIMREVSATYTLTAQVGSFNISGNNATLIVGRKITTEPGAISVTGNNINISASRNIIAETGEINLTGISANLVYNPVGYLLTVQTGIFNIVGQNSELKIGRNMVATAGQYFITGNNANIFKAKQTQPVIFVIKKSNDHSIKIKNNININVKPNITTEITITINNNKQATIKI